MYGSGAGCSGICFSARSESVAVSGEGEDVSSREVTSPSGLVISFSGNATSFLDGVVPFSGNAISFLDWTNLLFR